MYSCEVQLVLASIEDENTVTRVFGEHFYEKSDDNVEGFCSENREFEKFPQNLQAIFNNLKVIKINHAGLLKIESSDLKPFGEILKYLDLSNNKIEEIDVDLFEFSPNLMTIDLSSNEIKSVGRGAFEELRNLKTLSIDENPCLTFDFPIQRTILEVEANCKPSESLKNSQEIDDLEAQIASLQFSEEVLKEELLRKNEEISMSIKYFNLMLSQKRLFDSNKQEVNSKTHEIGNKSLKELLKIMEQEEIKNLKQKNSKMESKITLLNDQLNFKDDKIAQLEEARKTLELELKTLNKPEFEVYKKIEDLSKKLQAEKIINSNLLMIIENEKLKLVENSRKSRE